ncbi:MAG: sterol desaturase family protein [Planctomycetia bacterium]|nr:sterol desaturase family protein [Planctomycetia bacterium]
MMSLCFQIAAWFAVLVVLMSLIEHQIHSRLMHRQPRFFLLRNLTARKRMFARHAVEHHQQYRQTFHDDAVPHGEDHGIRLNLLEGLIESLPVALLLSPFSWIAASMFPLVVCMHHLMWNQIHMEMHKPENRFFARWPLYKQLARHHYLHHRYPNKNFNVALPVGDFLCGTMAKATEADWQAMRAEGIA